MLSKLLILALVATTLSFAYRIEDPQHKDETDLGKVKENYNKVLEELKSIINKSGSEESEHNPAEIPKLLKEKRIAERKLRVNIRKANTKNNYDDVLQELERYIKIHGEEVFINNPGKVLKHIKEVNHQNKQSDVSGNAI
ncbi:hypothetical protein QAD02_022708 [Eretmocerus hayati]|uniref:Uncharacterized protein n=1 Tax=Eretmocerus hayati TaxID=131215 RepID=A0ACC2PWA4_9HYME|nr:hypothetical protein QAD02_022708 [Eretmocerus hayati]